MKKIIIGIILLFTIAGSKGQMVYQACVRDANGIVLTNDSVYIKLSIKADSANGTLIYSENHKTKTNAYGIVTLIAGKGTPVLGNFNTINWEMGSYFLKAETDLTCTGATYSPSSNRQMVYAPFAMLSNKSLSEADTAFTHSVAGQITGSNVTNWNNVFSWGNHATAGYLFTETGDNDPTNELELPNRTGMNGKFLKVVDSDSMEWFVLSNFALNGNYSNLNNKLTSGNNINIASNTIKMNVTGQSAGDLMYYKNGNWVRLPKGTNGQYLKMSDTVPMWKNGDTIHYVGELYGGGIIFHTYDGGRHGLIASLKDFNCLSYWSEDSVNYNNVESYWKGDSNTYYVSQQDPGIGSIKYTYTYCDFNGYTDWYVGSLTEMQLMMKQMFIINFKLESDTDPETIGLITDISNGNYWSSTECPNTSQAYSVNWKSFKISDNKINYLNKVRPIRKF